MNFKMSDKHGGNPSGILCAFCGELKGVALLGDYDDNDTKAPNAVVIDYEPCEQCQTLWDQGIALIGTRATPTVDDQMPITTNQKRYPTGDVMVIDFDAAKDLCGSTQQAELQKGDSVVVDQNLIEALAAQNDIP